MDCQPVIITNRNEQKLFGMLEQPVGEHKKDVAILILSPGIKMRVGPHRLYNKLSAKLVAAGYTVLRFDFYGLGDSEGEIEDRMLANVYNSIQSGRYVDDTRDAMQWMEQQHGYSKFILSGLCGGAITGLLAGCEDERVVGLLSLGLINVFEGGEENFSLYITDGQLEDLKRGYIDKLTDWESWKRLLTFKSDIRAIYKILVLPLKKTLSSFTSEQKTVDLFAELDEVKQDKNSNVNPKFASAFFKMLKNAKPQLLIYSGSDRLLSEFNEKFESVYSKQIKQYSALYDLHVIDEANHILSDSKWEEEMHVITLDWLKKHY